jgi:hypothetical protein
MTFSAEGLRRFLDSATFPVVVYAEKDNTPVMNADRARLARLIEAGSVFGWGSPSKLKGVKLCEPTRLGIDKGRELATLQQVAGLPCCGDPSKAFTIADGPWRQWKGNPAPRPSPWQNVRNHGGSAVPFGHQNVSRVLPGAESFAGGHSAHTP